MPTGLCFAVLAGSACTVTLDPVVSDDDSPQGVPALAVCSVFRGEAREYELCPEPLAWPAAEHDCRLRGAELASVESAAENSAIAAAAESVDTNVWLGGTRDEDLVWSWSTGLMFWRGDASGEATDEAYVRWAPDEPNDGSTVSNDSERCLALTLGDADWNDRVCAIELPYVCERELGR